MFTLQLLNFQPPRHCHLTFYGEKQNKKYVLTAEAHFVCFGLKNKTRGWTGLVTAEMKRKVSNLYQLC